MNDVYIHGSAINYSAITGLLYGFNFVRYDNKYCDTYRDHNAYEFRDDPSLFAPRNVRVEYNTFQYNNTGSTGGGAVRWFGLRHNKFFVNYISPQAGNFAGGAIDFEGCADKIEISYNTITGPNALTGVPPNGYAPFRQTGALEVYGRNMNIHDNTITGHGSDGIGAYSLFNATISNNHVLQDNGWYYTQGGMEVGGSFPTGPCEDVPRDTNGVTISANDSNPIDVTNNNAPLPTGPATQAYGVYLSDHSQASTDRLNGVSISPDNFSGAHPLLSLQYNVNLDPWVALYGYPTPAYSNPIHTEVLAPRFLPVDVVEASSLESSFSPLWPIPPKCSDLTDGQGNPAVPPPPPGSRMGSSRAKFKFSASNLGRTGGPGGASGIVQIEGAFSALGNDTEGAGGPSFFPSLCYFAYDAVNNLFYWSDNNNGWIGPTVIGSGQDIASPTGCILHAATFTSWISSGRPPAVPTAYNFDLTVDVSLPTSQPKYHIYGWAENSDFLFDTCGAGGGGTCPTWKYSGYWKVQ